MPSHRLRSIVIGIWMLVVAVLLGARAALIASPISAMEAGGWLLFAVAPPAVLLRFVFQASPSTIAQVLYDTEHPDNVVTAAGAHHGSSK